MAKKTKKKVFFMKKAAKASRGTKMAKVKGFFANPYTQAIGTGILGGAAYGLTIMVFEKLCKTEVTVEDKTDVTSRVDCDEEDEIEYTFSRGGACSYYVSATFTKAVDPDVIAELKKIKSKAELVQRLRELDVPMKGLYVG